MAMAKRSWFFDANLSSARTIPGLVKEETEDQNDSESAFWNKTCLKPSFLLHSELCALALWSKRHLDCLKQRSRRGRGVQGMLLKHFNTRSWTKTTTLFYFGCCKFCKWLVKAMQILHWFAPLNSARQCPQKVPYSKSSYILAPKLLDQHHPATANTFVPTKWNFS